MFEEEAEEEWEEEEEEEVEEEEEEVWMGALVTPWGDLEDNGQALLPVPCTQHGIPCTKKKMHCTEQSGFVSVLPSWTSGVGILYPY